MQRNSKMANFNVSDEQGRKEERRTLLGRQNCSLVCATSFQQWKLLLLFGLLLLPLLGECVSATVTEDDKRLAELWPLKLEVETGLYRLNEIYQLTLEAQTYFKNAERYNQRLADHFSERGLGARGLGAARGSGAGAGAARGLGARHVVNSNDEGSRSKTGSVLFGAFSILLIICIITIIFLSILHYRNSTRQKVTPPSSE